MSDKEGLKNPRVTAFAANWVHQQRDSGKTFQKIADELGTTKVHVLKLGQGKMGAGQKTEDCLAALLFGGSIDRLRSAANEYWDAHPEVRAQFLPPPSVVEFIPEHLEMDDQTRKAVDLAMSMGASQADVNETLELLAKDGERPDPIRLATMIVDRSKWRAHADTVGTAVEDEEPLPSAEEARKRIRARRAKE